MGPRRGLPLDARRREAPFPGLRRRLREAVGGDHHEPGVQQVGVGVRRRPDGRRHNCIIHHGRLVQFRGESYRVRHALMREG